MKFTERHLFKNIPIRRDLFLLRARSEHAPNLRRTMYNTRENIIIRVRIPRRPRDVSEQTSMDKRVTMRHKRCSGNIQTNKPQKRILELLRRGS